VNGISLDARGERAAFAVTTMSADDDGYVGSIRIVSLADGFVRAYTRGAARDGQPRFSSDGRRLLFLSDRSGRRQIWLLDVDGGEPFPAPSLPGDVSTAAFSPDGRRVVAVLSDDARRRDVARRGWRRVDRIRYRADGAGYLDDMPQLWLIDLESGATRSLTDGSGWVAAPAWSPDGARIAFAGEHRAQADSIWHTELWTVDVDVPGSPTKRCEFGGAIEAPSWSPDGSRIAFTGFDNEDGYALAPLRLFQANADGSSLRCLTASCDWVCGNHVLNDLEASPTVVAPLWSQDGSILTLGTSGGSTGIYRVTPEGAATALTERSVTISEFAVAGGQIAFCASNTSTPPEIYVVGADGAKPRRITFETTSWCEGKQLRVAERFTTAGRSGPLDGWHMRAGATEVRPAILEIHGGPHAAYGDAFFLEFQLLAAAGFDVIFCNPRGSQSYGDAFARGLTGDWAAPAFDDCMDVLDDAIGRGGIDLARLGVAGGSYGGYLTAWTVGHSDRFKAAIAMRPAINLESLWGTSEVGRMLEHELGCRPLDGDLYRRCSPLTYADSIRTPLLLIHAEQDFRCPIEQSEQLFTALKTRGAQVEFLRFAESDHGLSRSGRPRLRVARLTAIVDWFVRHLGNNR
jgi:dipeptidyl aminopeptidase/acylaminoacyl peptidase